MLDKLKLLGGLYMEISLTIFIIFTIAISVLAVYSIILIFGIGSGRLYSNEFTPINRKAIVYNDYKNSRFGVMLFVFLLFYECGLAGYVFKRYIIASVFTGLVLLSLAAIVYDDNSEENERICFLIRKFDIQSDYEDEFSKTDKFFTLFNSIEDKSAPVVLGKYDEIEDFKTFILVSSMPMLDKKLLKLDILDKS